MIEMSEIIKEYIGKKEYDNDCAIFIKDILEKIGIKIDISTKDVKDEDYKIVLTELDKWGERVVKPITGNILGIVTKENTLHIGLFIDNYGRFFHIHNGRGIISKINPIMNKECYIYNFKLSPTEPLNNFEGQKCLG